MMAKQVKKTSRRRSVSRARADTIKPRLAPVQARSRERREQILIAALSILKEKGYDGLNLREVAQRAGIPIGSLYHFFPNRASVVRALGEINLQRIEAGLANGLGNQAANLDQWVDGALDAVHDAYLKCPGLIETWAGMQSNPISRALDIDDTLRNATSLESVMRERGLKAQGHTSFAVALAITATTGAIERLALQLPSAPSRELREAYSVILRTYLRTIQAKR